MCNANSIIAMNMAGCHQIRKRLDEQTFDGALQWSSAISEVDTLSEQELPGTVCHIYEKRLIGQSGWTRCCTSSSSMSMILSSSSFPKALNTTILSRRLKNSGVNRRRAASTPARASLFVTAGPRLLSDSGAARNPSCGLTSELISAAPTLLVMKIRAFEKSTFRLSPSVSVALSTRKNSRNWRNLPDRRRAGFQLPASERDQIRRWHPETRAVLTARAPAPARAHRAPAASVPASCVRRDAHLVMQPKPGRSPVSLHRRRRETQHV